MLSLVGSIEQKLTSETIQKATKLNTRFSKLINFILRSFRSMGMNIREFCNIELLSIDGSIEQKLTSETIQKATKLNTRFSKLINFIITLRSFRSMGMKIREFCNIEMLSLDGSFEQKLTSETIQKATKLNTRFSKLINFIITLRSFRSM